MGVVSFKLNMHNISNMSIAFIEQTMLTFMHNMPSCKHSISSQYAIVDEPTRGSPSIMHVQYVIIHVTICHHTCTTCPISTCICCMPTSRHNILTCTHNMPTCIHNIQTCDVHTQHAVMHACITSSSHCPKDQSEWMSPQGDFPPSHTFEKDFEVAEKLYRLETNIKDRWENHSQPPKGPGVCCIRYWFYHRRASLSEQHTDLLICHWALSCTRQVSHKPTARTALSVRLHTHEVSFTLKSSCISDVYKCRLCMALTWSDLNHRRDRNLYCLLVTCRRWSVANKE